MKQMEQYLIDINDTIKFAAGKLECIADKVLFVVDEDKRLMGSISDGDIRRSIMETLDFNINNTVKEIMNPSPYYTFSKREIINNKFQSVPIVDQNRVILDIYTEKSNYIEIGRHRISNNNNPYIIAEIGNNHNGDISLAYKLIDSAIEAKCHAVKFQLRDMNSLYRSKTLAFVDSDLSVEYTVDLLNKFQLTLDEHKEVHAYCETKGIQYLCTPWDIPSVEFLETNFNLPAYKVASADLTNVALIDRLIKLNKPLILSTGMSTFTEIEQVIKILNDANAKFILLHCNSTYPAAPSDINLEFIKTLKTIHPLIGYSGHERGISISLAAVALGSVLIERHLTTDVDMEGPDHKASLLPKELLELTHGINEVYLAKGNGGLRNPTQGEIINRENLAKSLVANVRISEGQIITTEMVAIKSPGQGLSPLKLNLLVDTKAKRDFNIDDYFYEIRPPRTQSNKLPIYFRLVLGHPRKIS